MRAAALLLLSACSCVFLCHCLLSLMPMPIQCLSSDAFMAEFLLAELLLQVFLIIVFFRSCNHTYIALCSCWG